MRTFSKLATALAAVALSCSMVGVGAAFAEESLVGGGITREGNTVYANGTPVVIKKSADGAAYVFDGSGTTKLDEAPLPSSFTVYGGGKGVAVEGDTSITIEGVSAAVYGGGWNAPVSGSTHISVHNASTGTLYGGGYSDGTGDATVGGDVTIELTGTGTKSGVHGGGNATATKGDAVADVVGAVTVTCDNFNHQAGSSVAGGGYAFAQGTFSAQANVGAVSVTGAGPTYVIRGGGSATSKADGSARADVLGHVALDLSNVDAREIYGGGYASGAQAHATAGSVNTAVAGDEVMILQGGGQSSNGGVADVTGAIASSLSDCSNLYGYVCGGGVAYSGGSAKAASASLSLVQSDIPVDEQFGNLVAAAIYGGGVANGAGSNADIAGTASLSIAGGELAGSLYGGGEATGGGSASAGSVSVAFSNMQGSLYSDGNTYVPSLFLAGETDADSAATFGAYPVTATIDNCPIEHVWGALQDGGPLEVSGTSTVTLRGSTALQTLACVDAVDIDAPLRIAMFMQNTDAPTMITARGIKTGDPVVVCDDADLDAAWFALSDGDLSYAVEEGKSVWRIAKRHVPVDVTVADPTVPSVKIDFDQEKIDSLLTDEERAAFETGTPVSFTVAVKALEPATVDKPVETALEQTVAQNGLAIAQHLDVSFIKRVGDAEALVAESAAPLRLEFAIPAELLAPEGQDERVFSVVRVHERADGSLETAVLPDLDDVAETITVETDRFSVYALAYEKAAGEDPAPPVDSDDPVVPTPDPTPTPTPDDPTPAPKPDPTPKPEDPKPTPDPAPFPKPTPTPEVPTPTPAPIDPAEPKLEPEVVEKNPAKPLPATETLAATGDSAHGALALGCLAIAAAAAAAVSIRRARRC